MHPNKDNLMTSHMTRQEIQMACETREEVAYNRGMEGELLVQQIVVGLCTLVQHSGLHMLHCQLVHMVQQVLKVLQKMKMFRIMKIKDPEGLSNSLLHLDDHD